MQILLRASPMAVVRAVVLPAAVLRRVVQILLGGEPGRPRRAASHLTVVIMPEHHVRVVDPAGRDLAPEVVSLAKVLGLHRRWAVGELVSVDGGGPLRAVVSQSVGEVHAVGGVVQAAGTHLEVSVGTAAAAAVVEMGGEGVLALLPVEGILRLIILWFLLQLLQSHRFLSLSIFFGGFVAFGGRRRLGPILRCSPVELLNLLRHESLCRNLRHYHLLKTHLKYYGK